MTKKASRPDEAFVEPLTRRERETLALLAHGYSAPEIAELLTLAVSSVKYHIQHIYGKLGVHSKRQAVTRARSLGLLDNSPAASPSAAQPSTDVAPRPKHNLPLQITRFFGRDDDISRVKERLAEHRLVSLTGSGGVGKTRLALKIADEVLAEFAAGVWFVELALLSDPLLVPQQVAATLGLRTEPARPILDTLTDFLRGRQILIVLDNCEHLLDPCARLADYLLRACSQLRILASSREPLGIAGEAVFHVPSLPFPNPDHMPPIEQLDDYTAVSLFVDRACLVRPEYRVTAQNAASVARICQRLDGIPLAVELAAARLRLLNTEMLAARLEDAFGLLTSGSRTALPRQQTLRATIDWSYDLLSETERLLLQRLSVFAGGCTLEAAEAVCSGDGLEAGQVLDGLASLVTKSLVLGQRQPGEEMRYRLLEMVRQYAYAKLQAKGDSDTIHTRHRDFFVKFAEANAPRGNIRARRLWAGKHQADQENLRLALEWSFSDLYAHDNVEAGPKLVMALFFFNPASNFVWTTYHEYIAWYHRAIAWCQSRPNVSARLYARLLASGSEAMAINDLQTALAWAEQAVEISRRLGPEGNDTLMLSLNHRGVRYLELDEVEQASASFAEAEAIFQALEREKVPPNPDVVTMAIYAYRRSELENAQGRYKNAITYAQESIRLHQAAGNPGGAFFPLINCASACLGLREHHQAHRHLRAALRLADEWGSSWAMATVREWLGLTELAQGNLDRAWEYCQAGLRLAAQLPDRNIMARYLGLAASIAAKQAQSNRAARLSGASQALYKSQGRRQPESYALDTLLPDWRERPDQGAIFQAFEEGTAINVEQAVAGALGEAAY